jgi:hypothetical protein
MFTAMIGKLYEIAFFNAGADDFILKTTLRSERLLPPL